MASSLGIRAAPLEGWDDCSSLREPRAIALLPILALAPTNRTIEFSGGYAGEPVRLRVSSACQQYGRATRADAPLIWAVAGAMTHGMNRRGWAANFVILKDADLLKTIAPARGGTQVAQLRFSLARLANTRIELEWRRQGEWKRYDDTLLTVAAIKGGKHISAAEWLQDEVDDRQIRKVSADARRANGITSFLTSLGRATIGRSGQVRMPLREVYARSGSFDAPRKFRRSLAQAVDRASTEDLKLRIDGYGRQASLMIERPHIQQQTGETIFLQIGELTVEIPEERNGESLAGVLTIVD